MRSGTVVWEAQQILCPKVNDDTRNDMSKTWFQVCRRWPRYITIDEHVFKKKNHPASSKKRGTSRCFHPGMPLPHVNPLAPGFSRNMPAVGPALCGWKGLKQSPEDLASTVIAGNSSHLSGGRCRRSEATVLPGEDAAPWVSQALGKEMYETAAGGSLWACELHSHTRPGDSESRHRRANSPIERCSPRHTQIHQQMVWVLWAQGVSANFLKSLAKH